VDEQSIWKKEISFRRKKDARRKESTDDQPEAAPPEPQQSIWKKEVSLRRKPSPPATPEQQDDE